MLGLINAYSPVIDHEGQRFSNVQLYGMIRAIFCSLCTLYLIGLHLILMLLIVTTAIPWLQDNQESGQHLLASELSFIQGMVDTIETVFTPGGFTDTHEPPSLYFGTPTPEKDELWAKLYAVGNAVITKEEYRQLRVKTAALVDDPDHYIVTIEVFHQLHCLDYLRYASYVSAGQHHHSDESEWSRTHHLDHCIDYLRQVITCHGDLTPITFEAVPPSPGHFPFKPNFSISHTCRNFDQIYEFALQRNTSGYSVA